MYKHPITITAMSDLTPIQCFVNGLRRIQDIQDLTRMLDGCSLERLTVRFLEALRKLRKRGLRRLVSRVDFGELVNPYNLHNWPTRKDHIQAKCRAIAIAYLTHLLERPIPFSWEDLPKIEDCFCQDDSEIKALVYECNYKGFKPPVLTLSRSKKKDPRYYAHALYYGQLSKKLGKIWVKKLFLSGLSEWHQHKYTDVLQELIKDRKIEPERRLELVTLVCETFPDFAQLSQSPRNKTLPIALDHRCFDVAEVLHQHGFRMDNMRFSHAVRSFEPVHAMIMREEPVVAYNLLYQLVEEKEAIDQHFPYLERQLALPKAQRDEDKSLWSIEQQVMMHADRRKEVKAVLVAAMVVVFQQQMPCFYLPSSVTIRVASYL